MLQIYRIFSVLQAKNIIIVGIFFFRQTQKQQEKKSCSRGHDFFVISQKRTVEYVFHRNLNTLTLRQFDEFHGCISDACTLQKINAKLM